MSDLIDGVLKRNELTVSAAGGTELVALRLSKAIREEYLKGVQIIFSRVREIQSDKKVIFYCHDLPHDSESARLADPTFRKMLSKIVFVSQWQAEAYRNTFGLSYDEYVVIPNPIEPIRFVEKPTTGPIKMIYHTTPHRGLELLIPAFEALAERFDVELDVFSSFKIYGWEQRDKMYENLFEACRAHPKIHYHGFQPNDVIRKALETTHIFAYPNIWPETSCLAMIEALASGCNVVHPNHAALPETACNLTTMFQMSNQKHVIANQTLKHTVELVKLWQQNPLAMNESGKYRSRFINDIHDIQDIALIWESLLRDIKQPK